MWRLRNKSSYAPCRAGITSLIFFIALCFCACEAPEVKKARNSFQANNFKKAYLLYQEAIKTHPTPQMYFEFGLICFKLKKYREAKDAFQMAVKQKPDYAEAYIGLGQTCFIRTEWDEAENAYKNAIANDPDGHPEVYSNLGNLYEFVDRFDEAKRAYFQAVKLDPQHAAAYKGLGTVYMKETNYEKSLEYYEKYKDLVQTLASKGSSREAQ